MAAGNGGRFDILKVLAALADAIRDLARQTEKHEAGAASLRAEIADLKKRLTEIERRGGSRDRT